MCSKLCAEFVRLHQLSLNFVSHAEVPRSVVSHCKKVFFVSFLFPWHHSGMAVAYVYKSFRRLPCHFWSRARRRASKCIMKKSERHLTSTLMDVRWLWLNPPHSNTGFQRVIHRLTFLFTSKQPTGYFTSGFVWQKLSGRRPDLWLHDSLVFISCCCFCPARGCFA